MTRLIYCLLSILSASTATAAEPQYVTNTADFRPALGSSKTIILQAKDYQFQVGLDLKNLHDLTIKGTIEKDARTRILVKDRYADVMNITNGNNIVLQDLVMGHGPDSGECTGGVLKIKDTNSVRLENVQLFGSGIEGLALSNAKDILLENALINECNQAILTAINGSDLRIVKSVIKDNVGTIRSYGSRVIIEDSDISSASDPRTFFQSAKEPEFLNLRNFTIGKNQNRPGKIVVRRAKLSFRNSTAPLSPEAELKDVTIATIGREPSKRMRIGYLEGTESMPKDLEKKIIAKLEKLPHGMGMIPLGKSIPLLDKPGGKPIGKADLQWYHGVGGNIEMQVKKIRDKSIEIPQHELYHWGYQSEFSGPVVYATKDHHAQILANTIDGGVWIDVRPLKGMIHLATWIDVFASAVTWQIYGYDKFVVREKPDDKAKVVLTLSEKKHAIKRFTGKQSGQWAEVEVYGVKGLNQGGCQDPPAEPGKNWRGWIKIFNDFGVADTLGVYQSC